MSTPTQAPEMTPAPLEHCYRVYNTLKEEAEVVSIWRPEEEGDSPELERDLENGFVHSPELVWTGHLTNVFQRLGMSTPYYTTVMNDLKRMRCVEQIRRGGGAALSKWRLVTEPTDELFHTAVDLRGRPTTKTRLQQVEQQHRDLAKRVTKLEQALGLI